MKGFVEEFNIRSLAEARLVRLSMEYDIHPDDFVIDYDEGSGKWILEYDP